MIKSTTYLLRRNHGFECELRLLGVLRLLYRGYEQAVILGGIVDLNVNCDYWEF